MKQKLGRAVSLCFAGIAISLLGMSCASSEEEGVFTDKTKSDSGGDGSSAAGGWGGFGFGGSGGSGTGGTAFGGSSGSGFGGTGGSGFGGSGGASGAGVGGASGSSSTGGSSGTSGTCNPAFCPNSGVGTPCCQTPNGPCGSDTGMGCQATQDF